MRQQPVNASTFDRITSQYVNKVAVNYWEKLLTKTHESLKDKELVVAGKYNVISFLKIMFSKLISDGLDWQG